MAKAHVVIDEKLHSHLKSIHLKTGIAIQTLAEKMIEKGVKEYFFTQKINRQLIIKDK